MTDTADEKQRLKARELNELIRYTMWAVFTVTDRDALDANRGDAATELTDLLDQANGKGIVTRGCYDLQGMRADADYMLWWVVIEESERRRMLAEHGMMAREYPDVRANTVSSFALNDYEWMLAFEADELYRIVDLMRHLRGADARRHTRVEIPFYTGRRKPVAELVAALA
jgi:chlorite dismutase